MNETLFSRGDTEAVPGDPVLAGLGTSGDCCLQFISHGARIAIHVDEPSLLGPLRNLLPPGAREVEFDAADARYELRRVPSAVDPLTYAVFREGETLLREGLLPYAIMVLANGLHYGVARNSPSHLFVHAGAVEWRNQVILLPGPSRCGKSSLVDALVRHGATYFSDECAPVDERGWVSPYRKPLWLRSDHPRHRESAFAGGTDARDGASLPVGLILFQEYVLSAAWEPQSVTPGNALLRLVGQTPLAGEAPERTLAVLSRLVSSAAAYSVERPDADSVASLVLDLLERQSPGPIHHAASNNQTGSNPDRRSAHYASKVS